MADWPDLEKKPGKQIFGKGTRRFYTFLVIGTFFAPFVAAWILSECYNHHHAFSAYYWAVSFVLAGAYAVWSQLYSSFATTRFFRPRLLKKIGDEYAVDLSLAHHVGVSPGAIICYHGGGSTNWDIGFIVLESGLLKYYGDRTAFQLKPDQVTRVNLIGKYSKYGSKCPKFVVTWREKPELPEESFILQWEDVYSWDESVRMQNDALQMLRSWASVRSASAGSSDRLKPPSFPIMAMAASIAEHESVEATLGPVPTITSVTLAFICGTAVILTPYWILHNSHVNAGLLVVLALIVAIVVCNVVIAIFRKSMATKQQADESD